MKNKKNTIAGERKKGIIYILTDSDNKTLPFLRVALLICVISLTFPPLIIGLSNNPDCSWYIGLHKAAQMGLIFGKDVLFTYGPLGFLTIPIFINKTLWAYSALYTLALYSLTIFGCSLFILKTKTNLAKSIVFAFIFISVIRCILFWRFGRDFELTFCAFIFTYLYILNKKNLIWLSALAVFYSILPFIKFSAAIAGLITAMVFLCVLFYEKRRKESVFFLIAAFISFSILGSLLIGSPKTVFLYIYGCLQIVSGYNDAMAMYLKPPIRLLFTLLAIFAWASYAGLLFYCAFKKRRNDVIFFILSFGLLFLNYKMGYTRQDFEHIVFFYSMWLSVFGLYFLMSFAGAKLIKYFVFLFISIMFYNCYSDSIAWNIRVFDGLFRFDRIADGKNLMLCSNIFRNTSKDDKAQMALSKMMLMQFFPLKDETVNMLSGHTMDVFQSDIAVAEAYGFDWRPRPVFQSYSAYTEYLDSLNAKYFMSPSAPEYILYSMNPIDKRYPIFDEPLTFRTILQNYKLCAVDNNFIVLRKIPAPDIRQINDMGEALVNFGQWFELPKADNLPLFMEIRVKPGIIGSIWKLLYKPPLNAILLYKAQNRTPLGRWQLILSNASNGLFVSQFIKDTNDLTQIWNGDTQQNIRHIAIWTQHPYFYKDKVNVKFFTTSSKK